MNSLAQRRAAWARPPRRRLPAFLLTLIAAAAVTAAAPLAGASAQAVTAGATVPSDFVWTATPANISGDSTYINNFATNNQPGAILFITPNWNRGGVCPCAYDSSPIGVWYDDNAGQWAIFNENQSAMPASASFNVLVEPAGSSSAFVQTAAAANTHGNWTDISSPLTNGQPGAIVMVTQVWNPGTRVGVYNKHAVGVWYDKSRGQWAIFNEDKAAMTLGASFNVMVYGGRDGGVFIPQQATSANTSGNSTFISYGTDLPNWVVFETPVWNPNGVGGTYDASAAGVYWSGSAGKAAVFNENRAPMPLGAAFNVIIYRSTDFVWTATPGTISGDSTYINNFATNNQPGAVVFITPNWNPGGVCGCVYDTAPAGLRYDTGRHQWAIFNEDQSAMPAGASFNVHVAPAGSSSVLVVTATRASTAGGTTYINSPLTNNSPGSLLTVTQVWNPGGLGGTYNDHAVGVVYNPAYGMWGIFNEDGAAMPLGASFNVETVGWFPGDYPQVTATSGNTSFDSTFVPESTLFGATADPNFVVLDTPDFSPYYSAGGVAVGSPTGVWWSGSAGEAAVFTEDQSPMPLGAVFNLDT